MSQDELRHAVTQKARQGDSPSATLCSGDEPSPRLTQNPGAMKSQKGPAAKNCHSTESVTVRASDLVCELLFIWWRDVFQPQGDFLFFFFFLHKHRWFYLDSLPLSKRRGASSTFTMRHRKNITVSSQSPCFESFITVLTSASPRQTDFISSAWAPIL